METCPAVFDRWAESLFFPADVCVMDELGGMEDEAPLFRERVLNALRGSVPVIGVIKPKDTPFLNEVRAVPGVRVISVTPDNRNSLVPLLSEELKELLKASRG